MSEGVEGGRRLVAFIGEHGCVRACVPPFLPLTRLLLMYVCVSADLID